MGRSLVQTVNNTNQGVLENGIISLGSVVRRYGQGCQLNGSAIVLTGAGYYIVDALVVASSSTVGEVSIGLYDNGELLPGAIATNTISGEDGIASFVIPYTVRIKDCCGVKNITLVVTSGTGVTVSNCAIRVVKE